MVVKYLVFSLLFVVVAFGFCYWKKEKSDDIVRNSIQSVEIPECFAGLCPKYFSMNIDGDEQSESVVVIPTAMTQGAGKIWIVKDGKVIFDSGEKMRINVYQTDKQIEDGNGFVLQYGVEVNSTNGTETKYSYSDGQFLPEDN